MALETQFTTADDHSPAMSDLRHFRSPRLLVSFALSLSVIALWVLLHRYGGITKDAILYSFQALAIRHHDLLSDLYLGYGSQDSYTIFSPLYGFLIRLLGLNTAALVLLVLCKILFLTAAWTLSANLTDRRIAWLAVAMLVICVGRYGAASIFHFFEDYLSARSLAEAVVVTALACQYRGFPRLASTLVLLAMTIHPLMSLPGALLLACVWLPARACVVAAIAGVLAIFLLERLMPLLPPSMRMLAIMDPAWLAVVRDRSQHLFLDLWSLDDWKSNVRPFICLVVTATATPDARIRKLSFAAILVGAAGIGLAYVSCNGSPIAILIQGQSWRWVWLTSFTCILLLPYTFLQVWKNQSCGAICAVLLISGWSFAPIDGVACNSIGMLLWLMRFHISKRTSEYLNWAAIAIGLIIAAWIIANSWSLATSASVSNLEGRLAQILRGVFGLQIPAVVIFYALWHWLRTPRSNLRLGLVCITLLCGTLVVMPGSFLKIGPQGWASDSANFADWQKIIPPSSSVFVADGRNSGEFVWFTLLRNNYLTVSQSAGVVFSRATSLEVKRRGEVLLPIIKTPNWKVWSIGELIRSGVSEKSAYSIQPLTAGTLVAICSDPALDFVISREDVGLTSMRHELADDWKNWRLYDCRSLRVHAAIS